MKAAQDALDQRRQFLNDMLGGLRTLEADLEAAAQNVEFFYVVDFAAIFAYAYSEIHDDMSATLPNEPVERIAARRLIALKLVFERGDRSLLLIPPYAAELRNHVRAESIKVSLADLDTRSLYREKLQALIRHSQEFVDFMHSARSDDAVETELRQRALDVGKRFFPELYAVLRNQTRAGLQALRTLFDGGILADSDEVVPEMRGFQYDQAPESTNKWYKLITRRRGPKRVFQTFVDALACAYVQRANELLNTVGKVVVFVAPSAAVRDVLRSEAFIQLPNASAIGCVRDLDYFLLEFSHRRDLNSVRETVRSIESLLATLDAAGRHEVDLPGAQMTIAADTGEKWREAENYLLMGSTGLLEELIYAARPTTPDDTFLDLLKELYKAARTSAAEIAREGLDLISNLKADIFELYKWIPPAKTFASFLPLEIDQAAKGVRIRFPGFTDDAPVILRFVEPTVVNLAKHLRSVADHVSRDALLSMRTVVLAAAAEHVARPEHYLLAAYMLALENKPDPALRELERGLAVSGASAAHAELFYLAGMIRRRLFEPSRAVEMLEAALAARPDDERFLLEAAKAYWLRAYSKRLIDRNEARHWLVRAQEAIERASTQAGTNDEVSFRAQLSNVRAFVSCELALGDGNAGRQELETAAAAIEEIERLIPQEDWIGRFYDTRAWFGFATAKIDPSITAVERQVLLTRALADVQRALDLETIIDSRKHLLQEHKASIEAELLPVIRGNLKREGGVSSS